MNLICWLIDHKWMRRGIVKRADDPKPQLFYVRCVRCKALPYEDTTLPEWFANTRIVPRVKAFARRVRLWVKSRACWKPGHEWSPVSMYCQRCGMSGTEASESGEWMLPEWRKLWRVWLRDRFYVVKPYLKDQFILAVQAFNTRVGIERSTIFINGEKYMTRYIAYLGPLGLRLHQFFRGDDDRASHTHPWWFVTFPFTSYHEEMFEEGASKGIRLVKAWRFHYRGPGFEHVVLNRADFAGGGQPPWWTFVITGTKTDDWGFYPEPGKFIHWRDYK